MDISDENLPPEKSGYDLTMEGIGEEIGISKEDVDRIVEQSSESMQRLAMSVEMMFNSFQNMKEISLSGRELSIEETRKLYDELIEGMEITLQAYKDVRAELGD